ncbi:L,D-transpeptidase [Pseudonocardia halophobica]|uniref:L,D-transpeptidase n=1 Tax=Pseudonocardia halophobica TaxID=29401 RepID=A0A9W6L9F6_9PSEU|nr:L,D-transpeptidase [Pseudonocardia halophobica]GLL15105.1 L,D-transpeptidase [Pseudonocardia halophobica]
MGRHSVKRTAAGRLRGAAVTAAVLGLGSLVAAPAQAAPAQSAPRGDTGTAATVAGTPCTATAHACVDLATHRAWLLDGGEVARGPVRMMPGDATDPTPVGTFHVQWKDQNHVSDMPNHAPMPFSVFFADGGVAFHEGSLQNSSYGCVHLAHDDAVAFFNALQVGDEVQVH